MTGYQSAEVREVEDDAATASMERRAGGSATAGRARFPARPASDLCSPRAGASPSVVIGTRRVRRWIRRGSRCGDENSLGLTSMILGIVAAVFIWLMPLSILLGVLAITFGSIGLKPGPWWPRYQQGHRNCRSGLGHLLRAVEPDYLDCPVRLTARLTYREGTNTWLIRGPHRVNADRPTVALIGLVGRRLGILRRRHRSVSDWVHVIGKLSNITEAERLRTN